MGAPSSRTAADTFGSVVILTIGRNSNPGNRGDYDRR